MGTKQGTSSEPAAAACGKADRTNTNLRATAASGTTCSGPVAGCLWTVGIRAVAVTEAFLVRAMESRRAEAAWASESRWPESGRLDGGQIDWTQLNR